MNDFDQKENTITVYTENGIQNFSEEQFPALIQDSLGQMEVLDKKYREAELSAQRAQSQASRAKRRADDVKASAMSSQKKAEEISALSAGAFHRKEAIEGLQDGQVVLAKTQIGITDTMSQLTDVQGSLARVQSDFMDALKVSYEYDKSIANISKYLFVLGCSSITASQTVCRTIEMKLQNASREEISELARNELQSVVDNLRAQDNLIQRQQQVEEELGIYVDAVNSNRKQLSEHEQWIKAHAEEMQKRIDVDKELAEQIKKQEDINRQQEEELEQQRIADHLQDQRMDAGDQRDDNQDKKLEKQAQKDAEHDLRLAEGDRKDLQQDEVIGQLQNEIASNKQEIERLSDLLETMRKQTIVFGIVGLVALVLGILQFVL